MSAERLPKSIEQNSSVRRRSKENPELNEAMADLISKVLLEVLVYSRQQFLEKMNDDEFMQKKDVEPAAFRKWLQSPIMSGKLKGYTYGDLMFEHYSQHIIAEVEKEMQSKRVTIAWLPTMKSRVESRFNFQDFLSYAMKYKPVMDNSKISHFAL